MPTESTNTPSTGAASDTPLWTRLSVVVPNSAEEIVTAQLLPEEAPGRAWGLVIEDETAGALCSSGKPVPAGFVRISSYVPTAEADAAGERLRHSLQRLVSLTLLEEVPPVERQAVDSEDWQERWKEFFHVTRVSDRIVIRPPWRTFEPAPSDLVLEIEPGLAFGTGGHQTTQLSLRGLERVLGAIERPLGEVRVVDVGCGSGVLALACRMLGAGEVTATDVDPPALEATRENALRNGVTDGLRVTGAPIEELAASESFDLVIANIVSGTLMSLREALLGATASGGVLLLSGILTDEETQFRAEFETAETELVEREEMDDWLLLGYRLRKSRS